MRQSGSCKSRTYLLLYFTINDLGCVTALTTVSNHSAVVKRII